MGDFENMGAKIDSLFVDSRIWRFNLASILWRHALGCEPKHVWRAWRHCVRTWWFLMLTHNGLRIYRGTCTSFLDIEMYMWGYITALNLRKNIERFIEFSEVKCQYIAVEIFDVICKHVLPVRKSTRTCTCTLTLALKLSVQWSSVNLHPFLTLRKNVIIFQFYFEN